MRGLKCFISIILITLISSCSKIYLKVTNDQELTPGESYLAFKVILDHDKLDYWENGYATFDLTLARIDEEGITGSIHIPSVVEGKAYLLRMEPGVYSLKSGKFTAWRESYEIGTTIFVVKNNTISYSGDLHIVTKTFNHDVSGNIGSGRSSFKYIMKQWLNKSEATITEIQDLYPQLSAIKNFYIY